MLKQPQPFIQLQSSDDFKPNFDRIQQLLVDLLDTPVKDVHHIGGTKQTRYATEPIVDVLVTVQSLHDITSLDEKRLNYHRIYRLHHDYKKKVMMAQFQDMVTLKQIARLHIVEENNQMLYDYLTVDTLLTNDIAVIQSFDTFKTDILQTVQSVNEYENQKQQWFLQLLKNHKK
ncbi:GrpB family protein [Mammaliicoccus sp. Dog046]|uniref:GrpB family protein n=1 Tax=Mammaliicoccus sp. Dog046 TaxID=3034233 RepID=UPI002B263E0E|nr:GrpB family protein [Mammaliicoccus sp. Dog046]WQK85018.1 GrpB family protein [Mammaliicoccus sp. Dog046]